MQLISRAGLLGVEGTDRDILLQALANAGVHVTREGAGEPKHQEFTKADLYAWGLSGGVDSAKNRKALQKKIGLPSNISAKMLCQVLSVLYSKPKLEEILSANS